MSFYQTIDSQYKLSPDSTSIINGNRNVIENKIRNELTDLIPILDFVTSQIAEKYDLITNMQPRKAAIIEVLASNTCISCVEKEFKNHSFQQIDNIYCELHKLATSILTEKLHKNFIENNQKVVIATEAKIKYGTADVLITPSNYTTKLPSKPLEVLIEVKTGFSVSIPQLLRYLIDNNSRIILLWRIRNEQVLLLEGTEIQQLTIQFVKTIISRADRLLQESNFVCNHRSKPQEWTPNSQQLQYTLNDFSRGIIKTLPTLTKKVVEEFEKRTKNTT